MRERPLPTGTVTFLFSDMEGSTRLVQEVGPAAFTQILERHHAILREAFARHGGIERGTQGDSFLVMFSEAPSAVAAAVDAQRALQRESWPESADVRVRMGIHSGIGTLGGDDYIGVDVHRAARIAAAGHGGQVVVSDATRALTTESLPDGVHLRPLGELALRDLARPEPLYQVVGEGLRAGFPPLNAAGPSQGNLPARLTTFIGRERELDELEGLLHSSRLVTLVGPGGTGKTSLAIELARRQADRYADGAWLIPLESVDDPSIVPSLLASGFGLVSGGGGADALESRLAAFLEPRSMIVVVDNFEQVLPAAALLPRLMRASPGLMLVVTSRAPLHVTGEQEFPVPPLPVPEPGAPTRTPTANEALRLFEDRAARVRPGYRLVADDLDAVVEICRRLDGLPLGIEIAASRMALLSARDIAARLGRRLDLPGAASRDAPKRQRTLQGAIAWSYDLLGETDRQLLGTLSVFAGGFALAEAEQVAGLADAPGSDVLDGITSLVEHSLAQAAPSSFGSRFRLLTTIRMFGAERLEERGDAQAVRHRHAEAYLALAEGFASRLPGRGQAPLLDRLDEEHDNLRAATDWAIENGQAELAMRLAASLWRFWQGRGHIEEGWATVSRILTMPGADSPTPARLGLLDAAGGVAWWRDDLAGAGTFYAAQVALARTLGAPAALAHALTNLAHSQAIEGAAAETAAICAEALALYEQVGDVRGAARVRWLDAAARVRTSPAEAVAQLRELLAEYVQLGDDFYINVASGTLAWTLIAIGDLEGALEPGFRSLQIAREMRDIGAILVSLRGMEIQFHLGRLLGEAATLDGAYEAACDRYGISAPPAFTRHARQLWPGTDALRDELGVHEFETLRKAGARMTLDDACDLVEETVSRVLAVTPAGTGPGGP